MHRSLFTATLCLLCAFAMAQKTEWQVRINPGLFFFSGESAVKNQMADNYIGSIFTHQYGKRPGASITAGGLMQRVTAKKWLFGIGVDLQRLSAYSTIDSMSVYQDPGPGLMLKGKGESRFKSTNIAVSPFIGKRFGNISVTAGPEFSFFLSSAEEVEFKPDNGVDVPEQKEDDLGHPGMDFRFRLSLAYQIKKFSITTSYTKGFTNYYKGYVGADPEAYSNLFTIGLSYLLK